MHLALLLQSAINHLLLRGDTILLLVLARFSLMSTPLSRLPSSFTIASQTFIRIIEIMSRVLMLLNWRDLLIHPPSQLIVLRWTRLPTMYFIILAASSPTVNSMILLVHLSLVLILLEFHKPPTHRRLTRSVRRASAGLQTRASMLSPLCHWIRLHHLEIGQIEELEANRWMEAPGLPLLVQLIHPRWSLILRLMSISKCGWEPLACQHLESCMVRIRLMICSLVAIRLISSTISQPLTSPAPKVLCWAPHLGLVVRIHSWVLPTWLSVVSVYSWVSSS